MGAATGATVHLHYCMEKLIGWDMAQKVKDNCSKCGMKESKDCCSEQQTMLKLNTEHKASETHFLFSKLLPAAVQYNTEVSTPSLLSLSVIHPVGHAPPLKSDIPLFIRHCVFLI